MFLIGTPSQASRKAQAIADDPNIGYQKKLNEWKKSRVKELAGEDGWLSLIGLFWLSDGANTFGSDKSNSIVLPKSSSPKFAGTLSLVNGRINLQATPEARITFTGKLVSEMQLRSDADQQQTILQMGSLKLYIIKRGERIGLRVKDSANPARAQFRGLEYFPADLKWRIEGKFEPYTPEKTIPIANVLGMIDKMPSPGAIIFNIGTRTFRIDPVLEKGEPRLFVIFADQTSGKETYGAGRYLYVDPPDANGRVVLDFNLAYNPPCAFTRFATCPLPPPQNRLSIRVDAGEKKYSGEH